MKKSLDENNLEENLEETNEEVLEEVLEDKEFEEEQVKESIEEILEAVKHENRKLSDENRKLSNELSALIERLGRTTAEYENYRKRTSKEKEGIYTDACADVLKEILPVFDNLERATTVEGTVEDIKKGIDMTIKQFNMTLEKLNVVEIETAGEFDPNFHNAVMHIEDESFDKNSIAEVFQKGYKRGDKILRHSMVKVAN